MFVDSNFLLLNWLIFVFIKEALNWSKVYSKYIYNFPKDLFLSKKY